VRALAGSNVYRNCVRFCRSIKIIYLDEPQSRAVGIGRNVNLLDHLEVPKAARLGTKPAGILDVVGKNLSLKLVSLTIAKQHVELSWHFDGWDVAFSQRTPNIGRRLECEPVIGMRSKRDDVARFPDRPK
jgi:hypothetical protein